MRSLFFAALFVVYAVSSVRAAPPAELALKDQRHVTAPADSMVAGSAWIVFSATFTNTSEQPLWILARRDSDPPSISPYIRRLACADPSVSWLDINTAWCLSDYTYVRIDAKATLKFDIGVPEKYAGQDFRADLTVLAAEDATETLAVLSVTEHLTTRSSEQAGR